MITKELLNKIINDNSYVTYHFLGDPRLSTIFYHFFRLLPGNLYCKDKSGRYFLVSDYLIRSHGFANPNDVVGKTDTDLFQKEEANQLKSNDISVMKSNKAIIFEEVITLTDEKKRYYEVIKAPLKNISGEIIGIIGNSVEVTRRYLIENELRQSKQFTSKFIQNMEHDLRTPLSGLEGTIANLLIKKNEGIEKQTLEFSLSSVEELKIIINSILDFENQKYGYKILNEPFKLSQIFESVYRLYRPTANSKNIKLSYKIDSNIPRVLISDEWRIKHILVNLVGNALKFTNKGEVFFEAKLIRHEDRKVLVEFIVKDTGIGIPDDKREVIFERYVRLEGSNKGRYKGTGLGLANVKDYVDQLEGEFRPIQSEPGKGTTFGILIPMKESLDQAMSLPSDQETSKTDNIEFFHQLPREEKKLKRPDIKSAETKASKKASVQKKESPTSSVAEPLAKTTVLLVEDSPPAQFMGEIAIKGANCDVEVADSAEDALKMIEAKDYDIIFADIGLPGMDGVELTRHIRYNERKKGKRPTPIVGQTANANTKAKKAGIEAGMQDLLAKPLTPTNVSDMLRNYTPHFAQIAQIDAAPAIAKTIKATHVIDFETLKSWWQDKASLREAMTQTKDSTLKDIHDFKTAFAETDWKQLLFLTHKMRGGFVYLAASRVEEACGYLEDHLNHTKAPNEKTIEPLYQMVLTELDAAWQVLKKWVN